MNPKNARIALAALAAAGIAGTASADLTLTYDAVGAGAWVDTTYTGQSWDVVTGTEPVYNVRAFERFFSGGGESLTTWCLQIFEGLTFGATYDFECVDPADAPESPPAPGPMGAVRAAVVSDLFARWIDPSTGGIGGDASTADARAAAFQIVLWEITHENFTASDADGIVAQADIDMGGFQAFVDGDIEMFANDMIASLGDGGYLEAEGLAALLHPTGQDQIYVPAPGALALLGLGGLAAARRRRG